MLVNVFEIKLHKIFQCVDFLLWRSLVYLYLFLLPNIHLSAIQVLDFKSVRDSEYALLHNRQKIYMNYMCAFSRSKTGISERYFAPRSIFSENAMWKGSFSGRVSWNMDLKFKTFLCRATEWGVKILWNSEWP